MRPISAMSKALCGAAVALVAAAAPAPASFPGANGLIAYEHRDDIWVTKPDGSGQRLLVRDAFGPAWSADGKRLTFSRSGTFLDRSLAGVWVAEADGTRPSQVGRFLWSPTWAPDSQRLAAIDTREMLTVVTADGADAHEVRGTELPAPGDDLQMFDNVAAPGPAWSPDGSTIAVPARPLLSRSIIDIWGIGPDGTAFRPLAGLTGTSDATEPDWSPDGERVAFTLADGGSRIIRGADSGQPTAVPSGDAGEMRTVNTSSPAHAPDGTALAYQSDAAAPGGPPDVWVNTYGGENRLIATGAANPAWQPLGATPDCAAVRPDLAIIRPVDHRLHRVTLVSPEPGATIRINRVRVSEPPQGNRGPDALREKAADAIDLRADRNVAGRGRTYLVAFRLYRGGESCTGTVKVIVPGGADWRNPVPPQPSDRWYPVAIAGTQ